MNKNNFKNYFLRFVLFIVVYLLYGCTNQSPQTQVSLKTNAPGTCAGMDANQCKAVMVNNNPDDPNFLPPLVMIDPNTLRVFEVVVSDMRTSTGLLEQDLSYTVTGGPDYVVYAICPTNTTNNTCPNDPNIPCSTQTSCVTNTTVYNKVIVPELYDGQVYISIQGCVDQSRSTTNYTCGPKEQVIYNSHRPNKELLVLLIQKESLLNQIGGLAPTMQQYMTDFITNSNACAKDNAAAYALLQMKVRVIQQFIKAPLHFLVDTFKAGVQGIITPQGYQGLVNAATTSFDTIHDVLNEGICNASPGGQKLCNNFLKPVWGLIKPMILGNNPVTSISNLSDAIITLSNPDASAMRECTAEQEFTTEMKGIQTRQAFLYSQIQGVQAQINAIQSGATGTDPNAASAASSSTSGN